MNTALLSLVLASSPWSVQLDLADANARAVRSEANGRVRYSQVYPGIHLESYRAGADLEYDFIVEPGADPRRIAMRFAAASIEPNGDLVAGAVRHHAPVTYQIVDGHRRIVPSRFVQRGALVGFELGAFDAALPLIIDPVVTSSRFVNSPQDGSSNSTRDAAGNFLFADTGSGPTTLTKTDATGVPIFQRQIPNFLATPALATDAAGNIYLAGRIGPTCPANTTRVVGSVANPFRFLVFQKLTPDALTTLYLVCIQLQGQFNSAQQIKVDNAGNAYIAGVTESGVFPATFTQAPLQQGSSHAFLTKVDPTGSSFPFSIVLVPNTVTARFALDQAGNIYLGGTIEAPGVLPTVNAAQPNFGGGLSDGYLVKFNASGTQTLFATFLGGSESDEATALATDSKGNVALVGTTRSPNFPVVGSAALPHPGGFNTSGFVTRFNQSSGAITGSTCVPDSPFLSVAVQAGGEALITGRRNDDVLAAKIDLDGRLIFFRQDLPGSFIDTGHAIFTSPTGFDVTGLSNSSNLFTTAGPALQGTRDAFLATFSESADLRLTGPTNNTVNIMNFGPDTATTVELNVGIFLQQVVSMDPRCSIVTAKLAVCRLGNLLPTQQTQVTFVTTGSPSFNVKSSVFDPNTANNHN